MEKLKLILKAISESKPKGKEWEVVVIEEGLSLNNRYYSKELLLKECQKFEGAKIALYQYGDQFNHLPDTARDMETGFPKSIVGWLKEPRLEKIAEGKYAIVANAVIADAHEWLSSLLHEAWEDGVQDLMGFSIDATGNGEIREENGKKVFHVTAIDQVLELTIVTNPAAGGKLMRLVAGIEKEKVMFEKMREPLVKFLVEANPKFADKLKEASYDSVVDCLLELLNVWGPMGFGDKLKKLIDAVKSGGAMQEALDETIKQQAAIKEAATSLLKPDPNEGKNQGKEKGGDKMPPEATVDPKDFASLKESNAAQAKQLQEMNALYHKQLLNNKLLESKLPAATQEKIRKELEGKTFTEPELDEKIKLEREYASKIAESVHPGGITKIETGANSRDRISESLEATLAGDVIKNKAGETVQPFRGLHEAYYKLTRHPEPFSAKFKDDLWNEIQTGMSLRKLSGARIAEAITTTQFGEIFGDTLHRRMIAEYIAIGLDDWRKVCTVGPAVKDFRNVRVDRMGGYGTNFSTVAENGAYTAFTSPTDEEATYAVTKKGHLETITMEAVKNDDLRALRLIPMRMGRGAANTLYQFVFDFFRTNPTIYDTVAYFHATHGNLFTAALSDDNLNLMQIGMYDQAAYNEANFFIQPKIKYLLVPNELHQLGWQIANSNVEITSGQTATVPNYFKQHAMEVIMVPYWTDANDFVTLADPNLIPSIEIGFLEGNEQPEILQELPNTGSDFTNDATRLKVRHIYGGAVVEYRGAAKAVVP